MRVLEAEVSWRVDVAERLQYLQGDARALRGKVGEPAREPRSKERIGVYPCPFGSSRSLHHGEAVVRRCGGTTAPGRFGDNWLRVPR